VDQWGGALEGASVRLHQIPNGKTRVASVGADGRFTLAGLTPSNYEIEVVSDSDKVSTKLTLQARDQAVLSVLLRQEAAGVVTAVRDSFGVVTRLRGDMAGGAFGAFADMEVGRKAMVFMAPGAVPPPNAKMEAIEVTAQASRVEVANSATLAKDKDGSAG